MAHIISKKKYQSRAKRIWMNILNKECVRDTENITMLEIQLALLERKIAKFRAWNC